MAIIINLDLILQTKKLTLIELSNKANISLSSLFLLNSGKIKWLRFNHLNSICKELDCQPGDILKYSANKHLCNLE